MKPIQSRVSPEPRTSRITDHGLRIAFQPSLSARRVFAGWCVFVTLTLSSTALAFPPAPHHTIYGMVRNEMGEPIRSDDATVVLETVAGVQLQTTIVSSMRPGINYRLRVPMDAGLTPDNYRPTALRPSVSFRMKVLIGGVTYLPIETRANYANLGKPALSTRLDLTLGEDSDGDGLPDAWERALSDMLGGTLSLDDIRAGEDSDGDGLTNLQEYLAGTYAFDPQDGFRLDIAGTVDGRPALEFLAIRGRTYTLFGSADLKTWVPLDFRLSNDAPATPPRTAYYAADVRIVRIEAVLAPDQDMALFKMLVQ